MEPPRRLSKSAPAGSEGNMNRKKWGAAGMSALKEIESWARQGQSASLDLSRHSGQLAENVTEERMLYGKLLEMSKERYKFLNQNNYEQKTFLDRQKMKSAALRHKLVDVGANGQRIAWVTPSRDNTSTSLTEKGKSMSRSAMGTSVSEVPLHSSQDEDGEESVHHEQTGRKTRLKSGPSVIGYRRDKLFPTETASLDGVPSVASADNCKLPDLSAGTVSAAAVLDQRKTPGVRFAGDRSKSSMNTSSHQYERRTTSAGSRLGSTGQRRERPVSDRRYLRLANALCENYGLDKQKVDVNHIIRALDSLHVAPKRVYTVHKPKTSIFLQRFLHDRGLVT
jgi:hypothetical protein